jgi:hypothetical protein
MKKFTYQCHRKEFANIQEVIQQMQELNQELSDTDLRYLIPFNETYRIITSAVCNKLGTHYFDNDLLMQQFDIAFSHYYFNALHGYVNQTNIAPSWKILFEACRYNRYPQFIYLALGVNAHVNNDLPQTLYDVVKSNTYAHDYSLINRVISNELSTVIHSFHEESQYLNILKILLQPLYSFKLNKIIVAWRKNGWKNYQKLLEKTKTISEIETEAVTKAKLILNMKIFKI